MRLYQRTARQDIWQVGLKTPADNKQGFKRDRSKPAEPWMQYCSMQHDHLLIKKGQQYFTWHPKGSDWQYSLTRPDLRSAWEKEIEEFQSEVSELEGLDNEDKKSNYDSIDDLRTRIEERRDELQTNLDAMPEQLQESSVLNERIEALDELLENL